MKRMLISIELDVLPEDEKQLIDGMGDFITEVKKDLRGANAFVNIRILPEGEGNGQLQHQDNNRRDGADKVTVRG